MSGVRGSSAEMRPGRAWPGVADGEGADGRTAGAYARRDAADGPTARGLLVRAEIRAIWQWRRMTASTFRQLTPKAVGSAPARPRHV
jgi:hypothetical protein